MRVNQGRGGGHTTQMFLDILAGDKDSIIRCRVPSVTMRMFMETFNKLISGYTKDRVKLVDGRIVRFVSMSDIQSQIGFEGQLKTDL